jgi:hypothetical protein
MFAVRFRELLTDGTDREFSALMPRLNTVIGANHDPDTGEHTDITLDSLTARSGDLDLTGNLRFLKGKILLDALGNSSHVAALRPDQWTADQHNYNPPGSDFAFLIECTTDADRNLTGLERHTRQKQLMIFGNAGNFNITLRHNHTSSAEYNRFGLPNNTSLVLGSGEYAWFYYAVGAELWRAVSLL